MNRGFRYIDRIGADAEGETVLLFYCARYRHSTEAEWRSRIESGAVRLDDRPTSADTRLRRGQALSYDRAPWDEPAVPTSFAVLYEDDEIVAVDKPSGLPVLPGGHHLEHTLLALVRARYGQRPALSPLHRLGRATSGVVLFARTTRSGAKLSAAFRERRITKIYRALLTGTGLPAERTVSAPIGRVAYPPTGTLHAATAGGAPSTSVFRLLCEDRARDRSLVEVEIATGRAHQIRIHAATLGHPLVGDPLYVVGGGPAPLVAGARAPLPGDAGYHLHALRLAFRHPVTDATMKIVSPPPPLLRVGSDAA